MVDETSPLPIFHVSGCGNLAFSLAYIPYLTSPLDASFYRLNDGRTPLPTDRMLCGSCGKAVYLDEVHAAIRAARGLAGTFDPLFGDRYA